MKVWTWQATHQGVDALTIYDFKERTLASCKAIWYNSYNNCLGFRGQKPPMAQGILFQLSLPLLAQGLFCYSTSCALVDDCTLPQLFGCVKYFLKLFEKVLFTVLGIFLWIPEPLFELVDRLSLSTRLSYYL